MYDYICHANNLTHGKNCPKLNDLLSVTKNYAQCQITAVWT